MQQLPKKPSKMLRNLPGNTHPQTYSPNDPLQTHGRPFEGGNTRRIVTFKVQVLVVSHHCTIPSKIRVVSSTAPFSLASNALGGNIAKHWWWVLWPYGTKQSRHREHQRQKTLPRTNMFSWTSWFPRKQTSGNKIDKISQPSGSLPYPCCKP